MVQVGAGRLVVKVIIETCYFNDQEKIKAAQLYRQLEQILLKHLPVLARKVLVYMMLN